MVLLYGTYLPPAVALMVFVIHTLFYIIFLLQHMSKRYVWSHI